MNPKVDAFLENSGRWKAEFSLLRQIVLETGLTEELKWGTPCYTFQNRNVVLMHGFKEYCALLFFKGALLQDAEGILIRQTENVQSSRQVRFTDAGEIRKLEKILKAYVFEAIEVEKSGVKVEFRKTAETAVPEEFQKVLDELPLAKSAFEKLTPGRQRAYLLFFAAAKQSTTRQARIEKCLPKILAGKGLNE
jgi:uncharacterized protein YdeI (YjbR/CyaY-like superfamily)